VLDHDPDHIETLRKFGMKVFYGDATRMDLLESAGAAKAEVLIIKVKAPRYVAPFGNAQYTLPAAASGPIVWSIINDFGGTGPEHK
ncbi:NAD-binding protein, partial [Salmonella enterica subsp. enterica serovar Anatum]|nr:NAD-binding protein [Salmonella enterica subsp. enterica serovar Anatum]